ncbi:MAG: YHS domain-containing protein [Armatimonadota bacterium]|nr:YHS domain-containing protein [Armatimonadota bacterium]
MKKIVGIIVVLFVLALVIHAPAATGGTHGQTCGVHSGAACPVMKGASGQVTCPVMGKKVADLKNAPKSVYKGKTYYFCCPDCKPKFDKDPAKFIKTASAKGVVMCPVMGGKVANTKTAPKSTYKGKTYYFCCPGCKPKFDKSPATYAKPAAANAEIKCPVSGGKVTSLKTAEKSVYKGKTYYFCCPGCKPQFDKNPEKYVR